MARREWFEDMFDSLYVEVLEHQDRGMAQAQVDFLLDALNLAKGARVLDIPCGYGRHAGLLAARGFDVVGVDLSPTMIREAKRRWHGRGHLRFIRGDMRGIAYRGEFDAALNLFTSFGYFSDRENRTTLRRLTRAVRPGGWVVIDHRNREYDQKYPIHNSWAIEGNVIILQDVRPRPKGDVWEGTWRLIRLGDSRIHNRVVRIRKYSLPEWRALFEWAGLRLRRAYPGYRPEKASRFGSPRLLLLGQRVR